MNIFFSKIRYSTTIIIIFFTSLLLITLLLIIFYNQNQLNEIYEDKASEEAQTIVNAFNIALGEANSILLTVLNDKEAMCSTKKYQLNRMVGSSRWVTSITVVHNDRMVCSSFFDVGSNINTVLKDYTQHELNLLYSKYLTPKRAISTYRIQKGNWTIFAGINIMGIVNGAKKGQFANNTYISINNNWANSNGELLINQKPPSDGWLVFKSEKYPFSVLVNYDAIVQTSTTDTPYITIIIISLITGITILLYLILTAPKRELLRALINNEFIPYYQLVVSSEDMTWRGVEVLMRWQHPKRGLILPKDFISLAERTKIIVPIMKKLLRQVASELIPHTDKLPAPFFIAFNINADQLEDPDFLNDCKSFLAKFPENTIYMVLELAESQLFSSSNLMKLQNFKAIGVKIAMDDFGTGYSNLGYIDNHNLNHLKIDRVFISKIDDTYTKVPIIDYIISLAKNMDLVIIAEGVENEKQLHYLTTRGVEYIQGFLFSKPTDINNMIIALSNPIKM